MTQAAQPAQTVFLGHEFNDRAVQEKHWQEMERAEAGGMVRVIEYGVDSNLFKTSVIMNETTLISFTASAYKPVFGIDVSDYAAINTVSERMALKLEAI